MKTNLSLFRRSFLASIAALAFAVTSSARADDLGDALRHAGWEGILGTWVDSDTKGEVIKTIYAWKFEDKLIEVNTSYGDTKSVSLMAFDPDKEAVFSVSGDNKGGGSIGKWSMDGEDAILELQYRSGEGEKGTMKIRHHMVDGDTMKVTISSEENGQTGELTLVRAKK
ncbi:MAG: hypothetical protein ACSHYF_13930 [Verrucomicrobiaceae bacterium]